MKTPQFEEMANRWNSDAKTYIVYSREAHPRARGLEFLNKAADEMMKRDKDGDNQVTFEEYGGPARGFEPFDVNNDGIVNTHELLASRKIEQYGDIESPETMDQRLALANRYRDECPGDIPVLVDGMDDAVSAAYGKMPNSAFVIGTDGKVTHKFPWANVRDVETALAELLDREPPQQDASPPQWETIRTELDLARAEKKPLLLEFTSPGCGACEAMEKKTLSEAGVEKSLGSFVQAKVGVEKDAYWALFEALNLSATPAFVVIEDGPTVKRQSQGFVDAEAFVQFLEG